MKKKTKAKKYRLIEQPEQEEQISEKDNPTHSYSNHFKMGEVKGFDAVMREINNAH